MYRRSYNFGFGVPSMPSAVKTLIFANVIVFFVQLILNNILSPLSVPIVRESGGIQELVSTITVQRFDSWFALIPHWVVTQARIWQLASYMFLHGNLFHILINMLILWFFGSELERMWGSRQFVKFYLLCGIGAALFHMVFSFQSVIPVIGASGAVYGVMMAFAVLFPDRIITLLLFFIFPIQIKVKYLVMIAVASSVIGGISNLFGDQIGTAHLAHLGGMAVGYLLLRKKLPLDRIKQYGAKKVRERRVAAEAKKREEIQRLRDEVDAILDKINEVGYENLSDKEKKLLQEASRYLSQD